MRPTSTLSAVLLALLATPALPSNDPVGNAPEATARMVAGVTFTGERRTTLGASQHVLAWEWPAAEECEAHGDWSGTIDSSGSLEMSVSVFARPRVYSILCRDAQGLGSRTITVD